MMTYEIGKTKFIVSLDNLVNNKKKVNLLFLTFFLSL
jgi:hypothetical protein